MGLIRVNKISYNGEKYHFESIEFKNNIILIEGDNGTGKSTFCNFIYYALGGEVQSFRKSHGKRHNEVTSDVDNYVDLYITVNSSNFLLRRYIGDNDITVIPYDVSPDGYQLFNDKTKVYPVNRSNDNTVFSDWIIAELGISIVELLHGYKTFKVNFTDLMRLIYHDQQPNPENIYKLPDTKSTYVSDTEMVRKAIFELLVGKAYSEYYDSIVKEKKLLQEQRTSKDLVSEYTLLASQMRGDKDKKNSLFLQNEILEKEEQIDKLHDARNSFKVNRPIASLDGQRLEAYKADLISSEVKESELKKELISRFDERYKLAFVKTETQAEIVRIQKIIFSHDQLNLFTSDTCPYCLASVDRIEGHCVCGSEIEEEQYERFFYTSKEYKNILKSKIKTLDTIEMAYDDCDAEISKIKAEIESLSEVSKSLKVKLSSLLRNLDQVVDVESLNDIDDKILELREDVINLSQLLSVESKLDNLQSDYEDVSNAAKDAKLKRQIYEAKAEGDIRAKVSAFSKKYNELMRETLPDCNSAKITSDNYLPEINGGLYTETSSLVSIRLMYFITLMHLSLSDPSVSYPKFLLIDTPETAGIEMDHLIKCISQLEKLSEYGVDFQVIITTGLGKYPDNLIGNRALYMPDKVKEHMLLKTL